MNSRRNRLIALLVGIVALTGLLLVLPGGAPSEPWAECKTDVPAPTPDSISVDLEEVVSLEAVTGVVAHPDGSLLTTSKAGIVHRTIGGESETALDLTDVVVDDGYEQGLLDIALADDGTTMYVSYTGADDALFVSSYRIDPEGEVVSTSERSLLMIEQPTNEHNGGGLVLGPDGMLWISVGDGGEGPTDDGISVSDYAHQRSQDLSALYGTILRIDPIGPESGEPYGIPEDNPLVGVDGARPEIWAHGLRNPWRFAVDGETGDVWIGDVGQFCTEEVDLVESGVGRSVSPNFGWPMYEADREFLVDEFGDVEGHVPPVATMEHATGACSVVGGVVYRGSSFPDLVGSFVFADSCDDLLRFARATGDEVEVVVLSVPMSQIVSIDEDADGELLLSSLVDGVQRVNPAS